MPSRTTLMTIAWVFGIIAVVSRIPIAKAFVFNGSP